MTLLRTGPPAAGTAVRVAPCALGAVADDLVAANRILAGLGVLDAFGHVSARHPDHPDRFLIACQCAAEAVTPDDILQFDLDSHPLRPTVRPLYLERFIHGRIMAARPDVGAVVHSHAPSVVPFAASQVPLAAIYHMASFLGSRTPVFEMRAEFGMTDLLVRSNAQADALTKVLGANSVVLMRGHGVCVVGANLREAVFRAYYTQQNATLQQQAIALGGGITCLDEEECRNATATNRGVITRPWEMWKAQFASR